VHGGRWWPSAEERAAAAYAPFQQQGVSSSSVEAAAPAVSTAAPAVRPLSPRPAGAGGGGEGGGVQGAPVRPRTKGTTSGGIARSKSGKGRREARRGWA
jgi:hypothetical protein